MAKRTPAEAYQALIRAGFTADQAVTMTAIAGGESGYDDANLGDTALQNATWGPSYGLFQIRTLKSETGRGTARDISRLAGNIDAQAQAAYQISNHGRDFTPWTVYTSGKYREFLPQAQRAAGATPTGGLLSTVTTGLTSSLTGGARDLVITGLVVLGGLGLAVLGVARAFRPQIKGAVDRVRGDAVKVAKAAVV